MKMHLADRHLFFKTVLLFSAGFIEPLLSRTAWAAPVDFNRDIAPVLTAHCVECHGPNVQKGKISLQRLSHALGEGEWKAAVLPGDPDGSKLIKSISGPEPVMPKAGPKLNDSEVALLRQWIAEGAPWPEKVVLREKVGEANELWSLRPLAPGLPPFRGAGGNAIDAFVRDRLAREGLMASGEADRRTLVRRLSFDLLGLPPSPEEVEGFVQDPDPMAYEKLVDRYLESPRYGERWARHWLDIAHYADTHGFERDQKRETAWPYRDYVIRALNEDLSYDQFLREQIAGDVIDPDRAEAVIATGFLAAGPWDKVGHDETPSPVLKRAARADDLDDMVTQVVTSTLGLTINCARCHNHKIDPITQADYYRLWAVFAGVTRGERPVPPAGGRAVKLRREELATTLRDLDSALESLAGKTLDLTTALRVGGRPGTGLDVNTGLISLSKQGFLSAVKVNQYHRPVTKDGEPVISFIDGVFLPHGGRSVPVSSQGHLVSDLPETSGQGWDAVRQGPVNSQDSTVLAGVDYQFPGHAMLGMHANSGITFDVRHDSALPGNHEVQFSAVIGYGGRTESSNADFHVYVDGQRVFRQMKFGRKDGAISVRAVVPGGARFLTLVVTDGGDGIGHDQVIVGDPKLLQLLPPGAATPERLQQVASLRYQRQQAQQELSGLPVPGKLYGPVTGAAPTVQVLLRGSPESPAEAVNPGALSNVTHLSPDFGTGATPEGERRQRLAEWIVHPGNPLTARVMVNRLWHHHFGRGIVDTPSDFGLGGGRPSHPELLDWLAADFMKGGWKLKRMHRLMVTSATYRQRSEMAASEQASAKDSSNRLLWRMNARRLDAESVRDAVLATSGCLNISMGGPGYQDFTFQDAYAPIYQHITADRPELWRRSIYRFIVRTTPNRFLTTLDCPDPTNLTPARLSTTTALQALSLMNNDFMLQQAGHFAKRVEQEAGPDMALQVERSFVRALQRRPEPAELRAALGVLRDQGLAQLCRLLLNVNEFCLVD